MAATSKIDCKSCITTPWIGVQQNRVFLRLPELTLLRESHAFSTSGVVVTCMVAATSRLR